MTPASGRSYTPDYPAVYRVFPGSTEKPTETADANMRLLESQPFAGAGFVPTTWLVSASNTTGVDKDFVARVVCASP